MPLSFALSRGSNITLWLVLIKRSGYQTVDWHILYILTVASLTPGEHCTECVECTATSVKLSAHYFHAHIFSKLSSTQCKTYWNKNLPAHSTVSRGYFTCESSIYHIFWRTNYTYIRNAITMGKNLSSVFFSFEIKFICRHLVNIKEVSLLGHLFSLVDSTSNDWFWLVYVVGKCLHLAAISHDGGRGSGEETGVPEKTSNTQPCGQV